MLVLFKILIYRRFQGCFGILLESNQADFVSARAIN